MFIDVSSELVTSINGRRFDSAPTVAELYDLLGRPSRIVEAGSPAPVKHRNNQMHVYDNCGLYFNEHHYTRRLQGCTAVFWPEEDGFQFTPRNAFEGRLRIAGYDVPTQTDLATVLKACPMDFKRWIAGGFSCSRNGHAVHLKAKGARLASGRRSKILRLVDISLSWPHDPWAEPTGDK